MAAEWYYAKNNEQNGPESLEELRRLADRGELLRTDLVWKTGMDEWMSAGSTEVFLKRSQPSPLQPPPLPVAPVEDQRKSAENTANEITPSTFYRHTSKEAQRHFEAARSTFVGHHRSIQQVGFTAYGFHVTHLEGVVGDLSKAIEADPDNDTYYWWRAMARGKNNALLLSDEAIEDLQTVLRINPRCIPALLLLAQSDMEMGFHFRAIRQLFTLLQIQPNHLQAMCLMTECYRWLPNGCMMDDQIHDRLSDAVQDIRHQAAGMSVPPLSHIEQQLFGDALSKPVLSLTAEWLEVRQTIKSCLEQGEEATNGGRPHDALRHFAEVASMEEWHDEAVSLPCLYELRADAHWRAGNQDQWKNDLASAADIWKSAVQWNDDPEVRSDPIACEILSVFYGDSAKVQRRLREYETALNHVSTAIELNQQRPDLYLLRVEIISDMMMNHIKEDVKKSRLDMILSDCNSALSIDGTLVDAYFKRGTFYQSQSQWPEAIADFRKCLELSPNDPTYKMLLDAAHTQLKYQQEYQAAKPATKTQASAGVAGGGKQFGIYYDCRECGHSMYAEEFDPEEWSVCENCGSREWQKFALNVRNTKEYVEKNGFFKRMLFGSSIQRSKRERREDREAYLLQRVYKLERNISLAKATRDWGAAQTFQLELAEVRRELREEFGS